MPHSHPAYRLGRAARRATLVRRWWRSIIDRDEIIAEWRSQWWHQISEHVVIEAMVTTGSAIGAAIFTGEFWGKAALGALVGGLGAIAVLIVAQAIRACFQVLRSIRRVNARAKERVDELIRNAHLYLEHPGLAPDHDDGMYRQRHRDSQHFASGVDSFLDRYYPHESIRLSRGFVNLDAPAFTDLPARAKHISKLNSMITMGLAKLEEIKESSKHPKPTPFNRVG